MRFHFAPSAGWMNDPNGLIHWRGRHHLFFQHNPDGTVAADIGWGHTSSADLLTWTEHPEALRPGVQRTDYDVDGCYSGCAVVDGDDVVLVYTGVEGSMQLPCIARSVDPGLIRFVKDPANPVIKGWPTDDTLAFRDHAVRRDGEGWHQVVGGRTEASGGTIFGYTSADLRTWTFDGYVLDAGQCDIPDSIWECPDLFDLQDRTTLVVSILDLERRFDAAQPIVWYATGAWQDRRLQPAYTARLDYGDRYYAAQSYQTADGRRLQFGWIRTDLDPAVSGLSRGVMSVARHLQLRGERIYSSPAAEIRRLRGEPQQATMAPAQGEIALRLAERSDAFELGLDEIEGEIAVIELQDHRTGRTFDIDVARLPSFGDTDSAPLTVLFDNGIIEVFRDGVPATWTDLAMTGVTSIRISRRASASPSHVVFWPLGP